MNLALAEALRQIWLLITLGSEARWDLKRRRRQDLEWRPWQWRPEDGGGGAGRI